MARLPGRRSVMAAAAVLAAHATRAGAQTTGDEHKARLFFGPMGLLFYRAARAIETGGLIDPADMEAIKPGIDRRAQPSELTLLQFAWEQGNVPAIDQLISEGADWRARLGTEEPRSLQDLLYEVQVSDDGAKAAAVLKVLLAHGLDPNERDDLSGEPILRQAIVSPNTTVERGLVEAGADPWATSPGPMHTTCIEVAIDSGEFKFLHWLIARGAFDHRPRGQVEAILQAMTKQPRSTPWVLQQNQSLAGAILQRTRLKPDPSVQSLLRDHPHRG